jgi:hypothetical protein
VTVQRNVSLPDVTASPSGAITCSTSEIRLQGSSATPGAIFQWEGPNGFVSNEPAPLTSVKGDYTLKVTHPQSGCALTVPVSVVENKEAPQITVVNTTGPTVLTCYVSPLTFTGSSDTPGATFKWTGPNGFEQANPVLNVTAPGTYVFTVTGANGCQSSRSRNITQTLVPPTPTANASGAITCDNETVTLTGSASGSGNVYRWAGPAGFSPAEGSQVFTTIPGDYTLTVTTRGGCTGTKVVTVADERVLPENVEATVSGVLDCDIDFVRLRGSSTTPDVSYQWYGPNDFSSNEQNAIATRVGTYVLTVTHPTSNCTVDKTVEVIYEECPQ